MEGIGYKILYSNSTLFLAVEVEEHLNNGWSLKGQPFCIKIRDGKFPLSDPPTIEYYQAVIREDI